MEANYDRIIACCSWEERFLEGLKQNHKLHPTAKLDLYCIEEFRRLYSSNLNTVKDTINDVNINSISINEEVDSFLKLEETIKNISGSNKILLDITTMPRFLIWYILHYLASFRINADFIYYQPEGYTKDKWLSRDPEQPRLLLKRSGIFLPDRPTALIVQPGFDVERIKQLLIRFEPSKLILLSQSGTQFENLERNKKVVQSSLSMEQIENREINAFQDDFGKKDISEVLTGIEEDTNIVMCSLGPKPGAIGMFMINEENPNIGLIHAPSKEYNLEYSFGCNKQHPIIGNVFNFS